VPVYDRSPADELGVVDRWADGVGWVAHPDEGGRRASHAVKPPESDGVWILDPLDAPGVDDLLADLGDVVGVAVCSDYHARDAATFARRYDVPVTVPSWCERAGERIDAPIDRIEVATGAGTGSNGTGAGASDGSPDRTDAAFGGFDLYPIRPLFAWHEVVAFRETDRTLYVPDYLSSHEKFCVGGERLGMPTVSRFSPPRDPFAGFEPERILFGHGEGILEGAEDALADALAGARRRLPRALLSNLPGEARAMLGAIRD
jgi:hypothetical protein